MATLDEAKEILKELQVPSYLQSDICGYTLLALAKLNKESAWVQSENNWYRIHDIIQYVHANYGVSYSENSRETFRKQAMHNFRNAGFIEDNGKATNSPNYCYRFTVEMLQLLQSYNTPNWKIKLLEFQKNKPSLIRLYSSKKEMKKMAVKINKDDYLFSPGKHNQLQKKILEEFAPRFAPNSECLYVGDTTNKDMVKDLEKLSKIGIKLTQHDKLPDVILYSAEKKWVYFIEAVTSVGPISPKRMLELENLSADAHFGKIYVTTFLDFKTYKKFADELAWETEVWIADMPDHMIHLNGDKFMGPRDSN